MALRDKLSVACAGLDSEECFFIQQEREKLMKLREEADKEADLEYRNGHRNHCFRCGTSSLAEIDYSGVKIDICVNEACGAVHLDPGELDQILQKDIGLVRKVQNAVFGIFQ